MSPSGSGPSQKTIAEATPWRITTWNLQGSHSLDHEFVRSHILSTHTDIFVAQELTKRQAGRLGGRLNMQVAWARKHTPFPWRSEGLAVLTQHRIDSWRAETITSAAPWSWRRRIILRAHIIASTGESLQLVNVHLSPHQAAARRKAEWTKIARSAPEGTVATAPDVIVGDFNDSVTNATAELANHFSMVDTTACANAPTCWTPGLRAGRRPTQRLDGILAAPTFTASEPTTPTDDYDRWAGISDHLPVTVTLRRSP